MTSTALQITSKITEIDEATWNACAGDANPTVSHAFFSALEESGAVRPQTGWLPQHLLLKDADDVIAIAPCYLKNHSYGEYVFDWGWADAYERAGGRYYPKLQVAVPFTPVPGPRLLVRPGVKLEKAYRALGQGLIALARSHSASSVHVTFCQEAERTALVTEGFLPRQGLQYHWQNEGYSDFESFLATLRSDKRKTLRRERREAQASGVQLRCLTGREITPDHWRAFYGFYLATVDKKGAHDYLNQAFFLQLGERMGERCLLVVAERDGQIVAAALNLIGQEALYGRNWGALEDHRFLHFECCYYQAIDWAIAKGLPRVEAGAQGEHKIQRGYRPTLTYSAHWIADPALAEPVAAFLSRERRAMEAERDALSSLLPFRRDQQEP